MNRKLSIINCQLYIFIIALLCLSCTEAWESHYDPDGKQSSSNRTLWEEISSRNELAAFRAVVERTSYRDLLDGDQMFTVFAPQGTLEAAA